MFAIEEKIICDDANQSIFLKQNETYTVIGLDLESELVILKGMYITHSLTKEKLYLKFRMNRFKKLPHMINPIEEPKVWFEVFVTIDDIDADGDAYTETIESFDTEEEAIKFIGDNQDLDYDKWTIGKDGTNVRIE